MAKRRDKLANPPHGKPLDTAGKPVTTDPVDGGVCIVNASVSPGHEAHVTRHHTKHGVAMLGLGVAWWFFGGPNLGWTKTSEMVKSRDPVTDQEVIAWEKRFLPGVDFLVGGLLASGVLVGASFLRLRRGGR